VLAALAFSIASLPTYGAIKSGKVLAGAAVFDRARSPASYWFFVIARGASVFAIGVYFAFNR
jgi:hypothetical protein